MIDLPQSVSASYYETVLNLELQKPEKNEVDIGRVLPTRTGAQLTRICGAKPIEECFDYVVQRWAAVGFALSSPYRPDKSNRTT